MQTEAISCKQLPDVLPFLFLQRPERVCELMSFFPESGEEEVEASLEWLVLKGLVKKYETPGGPVYFEKQ
jgi:hypothetical protein